MMTEIRGASNAKANRELAWNPAHPSWREGFRGIDEQVATIVFADPAVSKWIEYRIGWSIKRFVCTARRYRTIEIQAGNHILRWPPRSSWRPPPAWTSRYRLHSACPSSKVRIFHRMKEVGQHAGAVVLSGRAAKNRPPYSWP